jgi:D-amino-acid oxidase
VKRVAIIGAGVSGLTCAVVFAEQGYSTVIIAEEMGQQTTSAAAGAIWFPYDAEPFAAVLQWSLATYQVLEDLSRQPGTGVSMIELRTFARTGEVNIPEWAHKLGARRLERPAPATNAGNAHDLFPSGLTSCFTLHVPLTDTTIYLDYLANRFLAAGGKIHAPAHVENLNSVAREFEIVINCSGIGAKQLVPDADLEPHRGQVAIVPRLDIRHAVVCDESPLMYAIPRANDCLFGGTNEVSDNREIDPATTRRIVAECSRVLNIEKPAVLRERVGLRPFRKSGVCLHEAQLVDGRTVIHNYGHGGSGFTLSWGCASATFDLARSSL